MLRKCGIRLYVLHSVLLPLFYGHNLKFVTIKGSNVRQFIKIIMQEDTKLSKLIKTYISYKLFYFSFINNS